MITRSRNSRHSSYRESSVSALVGLFEVNGNTGGGWFLKMLLESWMLGRVELEHMKIDN